MLLTNLRGRTMDVPVDQYRVDWDRIVSKPQKAVKDFLRPFWETDLVFEELRIPGCLFRVDLLRFGVGGGVMVEVSPQQHGQFNPFFHGSLAGWKASLKRDLQKEEWARLNDLVYVELTQADLDAGLSKELFAARGVTL